MELLLNLLWALIATGLVWIWRTRWIRQRRRHDRNSLQEWTALSVALVLLFFAVSMTDDLHSEMAIFEECSTSRRNSPVFVDAHSLLQSGPALHSSGPAVLPRLSSLTSLSAARTVEPVTELWVSLLQSDPGFGRAPPASS